MNIVSKSVYHGSHVISWCFIKLPLLPVCTNLKLKLKEAAKDISESSEKVTELTKELAGLKQAHEEKTEELVVENAELKKQLEKLQKSTDALKSSCELKNTKITHVLTTSLTGYLASTTATSLPSLLPVFFILRNHRQADSHIYYT